MRLGKVTANETAATVSMESRAADDGVGRQIEARSVIIATRESSFDASFRSVPKRSAVGAMIHDVEAKVHKLQLISEWHSAVQKIQMMESKSLDFVPAQFVDVILDKISPSSANPLNQSMRIELERCTMFHSFVVDPVDQLFFFNNSGKRVVVGVSDVCRCLRQTSFQGIDI